jgi:tetratricopeptide (TPR) repeat protein
MVNPEYHKFSSLFNEGKASFVKGDYLSTSNELEKLINELDNLDEIEYLLLHVNALFLLGRSSLFEGKTKKSKNYFSKIKEITAKTELEEWGKKLDLLGGALLDQYFGKLDLSITKLSSIVDYLKEFKEEKQEIMGVVLNTLGISYFKKGLISQANEYNQQARDIIETIDNKFELSSIINNLGNIEYKQGNYCKAIECYNQSLKYSKTIENNMLISA